MPTTDELRDGKESWLSCPGFENTHVVSSIGRVRRSKDGHAGSYAGQFISQRKSNGYSRVSLRANKQPQKSIGVHRLVAMAFLGKPKAGQEVNHKNGKKSDNRLINLEWVSRSENALHAVHVLKTWPIRRGEMAVGSKLRDADIPSIRLRRAMGEPSSKICKDYGVTECTITMACNGTTWNHIPANPSALLIAVTKASKESRA